MVLRGAGGKYKGRDAMCNFIVLADIARENVCLKNRIIV
jgi:hypothetical protein